MLECRICKQKAIDETCSDTCQNQLNVLKTEAADQATELEGCVSTLTSFESLEFGPIWLRWQRLSARVHVLEAGVQRLREPLEARQDNEPNEVREWRAAQQQDNELDARVAEQDIPRLKKRIRKLEKTLTAFEQQWEDLSGDKVQAERRLNELLERTGQPPITTE
jgi:hypothetical protein